jgi:D,D-heptose 1,7-bisphosphate phosphatase
MILAAGLGTRLRPLTDSIPKCLVPIAGRPLLDYWIESLGDAGVAEARVNTHAHADQVRSYIERVNATGRLHLAESFEPELLGSAGTITANGDLADGVDEIIIVYADNFSDVDLGRLLAFHCTHGDPLTMLLFHTPYPRACGIAELDDVGRVVSFVEKPHTPRSDLANAGVYVVSAGAYREIAALGAFDLGFEVLPRFVGRMRGWPWEGYHLDIGNPEALARARRDAPTVRPPLGAGLPTPPSPRPTTAGKRPAVFLDRDGTLIEQVHYLSDPDRVRLLPRTAEALRRLHAAGFARVVVTNQSALGRGMISEEQLHQIHHEMNRQLAAEGTAVDAIYFCPEVPASDDRSVVEHGDRKPGPGMLIGAAEELDLNLDASWMVGDMLSDILAGINARCRGSILVRTGKGLSEAEAPLAVTYQVADDLLAAVDLILGDAQPTDDANGAGSARTESLHTLREPSR